MRNQGYIGINRKAKVFELEVTLILEYNSVVSLQTIRFPLAR